MSLSLRTALRIFKWMFAFSLLGVAISVLLLLFNGRDDFVQAVGAFGGDYDKVIADARAAGFEGSANFDLGNTLLAMPLAFASFGYAIVTAYAGGEVRSPKSGNRTAMLLLARHQRRDRGDPHGARDADVRQRLPWIGDVSSATPVPMATRSTRRRSSSSSSRC